MIGVQNVLAHDLMILNSTNLVEKSFVSPITAF
jgi:hypothetical protein